MSVTISSLNGDDWQLSRSPLRPEQGPVMPSLADAQPYGPVTVPGNVHLQIDLTDPLLDDAEVISVNHDEWLFVKSFEAEAPGEGERVFLFFKGVDYFCDVWLNGTHLGSHEGMFTDFELDATAAVQPQNRLVVAVSCPWRVDSRHFFTQPSNIFSVNRKSTEYMKGGLLHYWDGAPFSGNAVFPFGIWSDVELVRRRGACIGRIAVTTVDIRDDCAELDLHCEWWSDRQLDVELDVVIRPHDFAGTGHDYHPTVRIPAGQSASTTRLTLPDPALWWTWDIGHPHLYDVSVTAAGSTTTSRFGVRLLERDPRSLAYSLNGQRLFLRGVWYPFASLFPAAADPREQQRDVDMLVEANINHIVVYTYVEADALYDACDEAGVLVFQELPFVQLGPMRVLEPDHPRHEVWWDWALDSVANILRQRRGHASLVLWCAFAETRKDGQWLYGDYTAFSDALAGLVSTLAPDAIYHPSFCDFGEDHYWEGGFPNGDFWDHYEADARFVSEYGSIAPPVLETLEEFLPAAARWGLDERTGGRIGLPIDAEEYAYHWSFDYPGLCNSVARMYEWADRSVPTLERLVDAMQWYQALGLRYCAEIYRRRRFAAFAGCRTWSYRDQIPGARFTVVDHHQRPKMGYYALKQAYAPLLLSLDERLPLAAREAGTRYERDLVAVNDGRDAHELRVLTTLLDTRGVEQCRHETDMSVPPDGSATAAVSLPLPERTGTFLLRTSAVDEAGVPLPVSEWWQRVVERPFDRELRILLLGQARYSEPFRQALEKVPGLQLTVVDENSRHPQDSSWAVDLVERVDVIWFSGWDEAARQLRLSEFALIRDAVQAGVGLIHTGGQGSFHGGDGRGAMLDVTALADVLPVQLGPHEGVWDRVGVVHVGTARTALGIDLTGFVPTMYHRVTARPGADVHAWVDGHPLLISGRFEQGRTVALAAGFVAPIRKFAVEFHDIDATPSPWLRPQLRGYSRFWGGILATGLALLSAATGLPLRRSAAELAEELDTPLFELLAELPPTSLSATLSPGPSGGNTGVVHVVNQGETVARLVRASATSATTSDCRVRDGFVDLMPGTGADLRYEAPPGRLDLRLAVSAMNAPPVIVQAFVSDPAS